MTSGALFSTMRNMRCCARSIPSVPATSPLLEEHRKGVFHCAGCDLAAYPSETKYEFGNRLAEFLGFAARSDRHERGHVACS